MRQPNFADVDVEALLSQLTLEEKISLLSGQGSFKTTSIPARGIPSITVSNGSNYKQLKFRGLC